MPIYIIKYFYLMNRTAERPGLISRARSMAFFRNMTIAIVVSHPIRTYIITKDILLVFRQQVFL